MPNTIPNLTIRKAKVVDVPTIVNAQLAMALETESLTLDRPTVTRGVRYIVDHPETGFYFVMQSESEVVGVCMILYEWSDWRCGNVLWLHSLFVWPEWRRRGVFQFVFTKLQEMVASGDYRGLRLYVDKGNHGAQKAYESVGMNDEHYSLFEKMAET